MPRGRGTTHGCTTQTMRERFGCNWGKVGIDHRICAKEGCERPSIDLVCGPCYEKALRNIYRHRHAQKWLEGWKAKERSMSRPGFRGCGRVQASTRD